MSSPSSNQSIARLNVLVVDDNDVNREFLRAGLATMVGNVDVAADGKAAVERCREHCFDVILMDLHMPEMDGLSAFQRIRQPGMASQAARFIILTADARTEERSRMLEHGVDDCLTKPISIPQLARALLDPREAANATTAIPGPEELETRLVVREQALTVANGDEALVERMSRLFGEELERRLPELDQMMAERSYEQAASLLHQWRGATGFAGAARLHQACGRLRAHLLKNREPGPGAAYVDFLRVAHATRHALLGAIDQA